MDQGAERKNEIVIYVGTRKLAALLGEIGVGEPRIFNHSEILSPEGFDQGFVTNLERASAAIETLLDSLFAQTGLNGQKSAALREASVYVVLGNTKLNTYGFSSSQYFQGLRRTITTHEIRSVVSQTRSVATLPLSEFVLQALPDSFLVDDMADVRNPLGLDAHRLGVYLKIFTMDFQAFRNLARAFEAAEIDVNGYFPKTMMTSEAVLNEKEKEEGVLVVEIDRDFSYFTLWKNGRLLNTRLFPDGEQFLSARIAEDWQIEIHDAERVKDQHASLETSLNFGDELIPLVDRNGRGNYPIHRQAFHEKFLEQGKKWLNGILAASDAFVAEEKVLHPHVVFTGTGTRFDGFLEFLQKQFSREAVISRPRKIEAPNDLLLDLSLAPALGMFRWLAVHARQQERLIEPRGLFEKTFASARGWFSAYF